MSNEFPRLLYMGDVPVEASYHGSMLLYRLLQTYPSDRLTIMECGIEESKQARRLPAVSYYAALLPMPRLQKTRFADWYTAFCMRTAALRAFCLGGLVRAREPDIIITVTHGYSWITAAEIARRLNVPLQIICHDEWARAGVMQGWKDRIFGKYYRAATSRYCVSPFMAREYTQRYGVDGIVLYPSRSANSVRYAEPPQRLRTRTENFTCVFAGTINARGVVSALRRLAHSLEPFAGRLVIYGPLTADLAKTNGLDIANIELGGLLPPERLFDVLRERADALFVPMSFELVDRNNTEFSFPSKLADYSAIGLPLLIYGPPYCSAAKWAVENKGVAEIVVEDSGRALSEALHRLVCEPRHRIALAHKAIAVGETYFSHRTASESFFRSLKRSPF